MENKRICPECKTSFEPTRSDQVYCKTTCRWNAWRKRKGKNKGREIKDLSGIQQPETSDLFSSLRGVDGQKEPQLKQNFPQNNREERKIEEQKAVKSIPFETKQYIDATNEKTRVDAFGKRVLSDLQLCDQEIILEKETLQRISANKTTSNKYRNRSVDIDDLFGQDELYEFGKQMGNKNALEESQKRLGVLQNRKEEFLKELDKANNEMSSVVNRLKTIPQFEKPTPSQDKALLLSLLEGIKENKIKKVQRENEQTHLEENAFRENDFFSTEINTQEETAPENGKLISSSQLRKRKYKSFPFIGKWNDFFSSPAYAFHLAVHGKPGEGKSTFCVQFADYLARNFGKVVYVSGEEGLSKTLQDKIINNNIDNPYLIFADIKSYEEIKTEIENKYHFIFIDSLDTLRIDAMKLKELKERYPQSSFITISQSTKDGKMRGSQEIVHDADIAVKVENGIALTTKNRFQEKGTEFKVFPDSNKNQSH